MMLEMKSNIMYYNACVSPLKNITIALTTQWQLFQRVADYPVDDGFYPPSKRQWSSYQHRVPVPSADTVISSLDDYKHPLLHY
mmetsp:Transcript_22180/g.23743  ORF Transcript_22180/g.23743 Transcript_22180/m.23743 type:complete len:83 (+) Transcript_22180:114-362(+)